MILQLHQELEIWDIQKRNRGLYRVVKLQTLSDNRQSFILELVKKTFGFSYEGLGLSAFIVNGISEYRIYKESPKPQTTKWTCTGKRKGKLQVGKGFIRYKN